MCSEVLVCGCECVWDMSDEMNCVRKRVTGAYRKATDRAFGRCVALVTVFGRKRMTLCFGSMKVIKERGEVSELSPGGSNERRENINNCFIAKRGIRGSSVQAQHKDRHML